MKKKLFFVVIGGLLTLMNVQAKYFSVTVQKAEPIPGQIIESEVWNAVPKTQTFHAPWSKLEDETVFQCYFSRDYFYFKFQVTDNTMAYNRQYQKEMDVINDDRVEIFLSSTPDLKTYYCMEMNPEGHTLDNSTHYFRKFDYDWNFSTRELETRITSRGYIVSGRISLNEWKKLGIKPSKFYMGVFRADFTPQKSVVWYSMKKKYMKQPDFHTPGMFFETRKATPTKR